MYENYLALIPFFPLLAFLINSVLIKNKLTNVQAGLITFMSLFISFILVILTSLHVLKNGPVNVRLWEWMTYGNIKFDIHFIMDELSVVLSLMVTGIGSAIAFFSIGYMDHEEKVGKFFGFFALFAFSMLLLVHGENFLVLFMGWEGVGLSSYLLIGFWYEHTKNGNAAKKAFLANRVGDFGLVLGMIGFALVFNTISFTDLQHPDMALLVAHKEMLILSSLLLVLGAAGKSAQIPLFIWLPDAMMGPTPVSALMHAATMVTAGIFLLCRVSNVIVHFPIVLDVIAWIGALTALLASLIAMTQTDIKKILAYSTVSQLGYMVLACGVGAFSTGMFHVFTHAFFKALLFLCAASVIYGCHHEQNIFKMGGLKKKMPITFWTFVIGFLAISGIPGFSGFFSKDEILSMALTNPGNGVWLYSIALITALLTAFYMTRMLVLVFIVEPAKKDDHNHGHDKKHKKNKHDDHAHDDHEHSEIHESPSVMTIPLIILAICSFAAGYIGLPHIIGGHENSRLFQSFLERFVAKTTGHNELSAQTEIIMMGVTTFLILGSMGLAYYIYVKNDHAKMRDSLKAKFSTLWAISYNKFKVDEFYELTIIKPLYQFGHFLVDVVETHVINGVVKVVTKFTTSGGQFLDDNKPERLEMGILYIVIGLTVLVTAIFNAFIFR
ncbi:MAG: NADH-quinone oxidoreductase subunit L [Bacteriovorax sp.]|nr:NADH-quinone oxidoreductase subunit L [Bacteriovorax sp.]